MEFAGFLLRATGRVPCGGTAFAAVATFFNVRIAVTCLFAATLRTSLPVFAFQGFRPAEQSGNCGDAVVAVARTEHVPGTGADAPVLGGVGVETDPAHVLAVDQHPPAVDHFGDVTHGRDLEGRTEHQAQVRLADVPAQVRVELFGQPLAEEHNVLRAAGGKGFGIIRMRNRLRELRVRQSKPVPTQRQVGSNEDPNHAPPTYRFDVVAAVIALSTAGGLLLPDHGRPDLFDVRGGRAALDARG